MSSSSSSSSPPPSSSSSALQKVKENDRAIAELTADIYWSRTHRVLFALAVVSMVALIVFLIVFFNSQDQ